MLCIYSSNLADLLGHDFEEETKTEICGIIIARLRNELKNIQHTFFDNHFTVNYCCQISYSTYFVSIYDLMKISYISKISKTYLL